MDDMIYRQAAINAADRADYTGLSVEDVKKVTDEVVKELKQLPSAQLTREEFENELHNMFGHIWDCEIDHPIFQDTVGDIMEAVILLVYNNYTGKKGEQKWKG